MISQLTEAMIVNGVVLATVLASDLGPARKIGPARLLYHGVDTLKEGEHPLTGAVRYNLTFRRAL